MLEDLRFRFKMWRRILRWRLKGSPIPPPHAYKVRTVGEYAERFGTRTLVETGTYLGDMLDAHKRTFARLVSVELSDEFYNRARQRFVGEPHIELIHSDSGAAMAGVVSSLTGPTLFWLDGHYSGSGTAQGSLDTPIAAELAPILRDTRLHTVLIDDARLFNGQDDYPDMKQLENIVQQLRPGSGFALESDIIRITAPGR